MRVLAASFPDDASAQHARAQLIRAFTLDADQIGVEALALQPERKDLAILAGRFRDDVVDSARAVVVQFGGTMVIDIDAGGRNA